MIFLFLIKKEEEEEEELTLHGASLVSAVLGLLLDYVGQDEFDYGSCDVPTHISMSVICIFCTWCDAKITDLIFAVMISLMFHLHVY